MAATKKCHLLELPVELRNRIFELALANTTVFLDRKDPAPGVLTACKQIYAETYGIFLHLSEFRTNKWAPIAHLFGHNADKVALIKRLVIIDESFSWDEKHEDKVKMISSAYSAQRVIFSIHRQFAKHNIPTPPASAFQVAFKMSTDHITTTSDPWKSFESAVMESPSPLGLGVAEMSWLRQLVPKQTELFLHAHTSPVECWKIDWAFKPGPQCACPRIVEE